VFDSRAPVAKPCHTGDAVDFTRLVFSWSYGDLATQLRGLKITVAQGSSNENRVESLIRCVLC
jgi:hypothetical protein